MERWQSSVPSCRKVRSFLTTGNRGMMGGCMLWLLRMLRYLAMFLDGSNTSCRSPKSFSYLLGSFSHELLSRATGAKFRPLREIQARGFLVLWVILNTRWMKLLQTKGTKGKIR